MEPEAREKFDEIWAILREVAARQKAAERRAERAEQMEWKKAQKAFLNAFRKGNGNGRKHG